MTPHQQTLDAVLRAVTQQNERGGGRRNSRGWFDGHGVVCHDARVVSPAIIEVE